MRLIAITGEMRSGTSMMAEVIHFLGFPVVVSMLAPGHPTWRPEWEDPDLAVQLALGRGVTVESLVEHLRFRREAAERQAKYHGRSLPGISIKSPFLALNADAMEKAAIEVGMKGSWVVIGRGAEAVDASLRAALRGRDLENARKANERIRDVVEPGWSYEEFMEDPYGEVTDLAGELGITDTDCILRAVGRVQTKEVV